MTWLWSVLPFVGKAIHALEVQRRDELIEELTRQRDYWQRRAERLMDNALAKAGAIDGPTMRDAPAPGRGVAEMVAAAMAVTEIDTTQKKRGA